MTTVPVCHSALVVIYTGLGDGRCTLTEARKKESHLSYEVKSNWAIVIGSLEKIENSIR